MNTTCKLPEENNFINTVFYIQKIPILMFETPITTTLEVQLIYIVLLICFKLVIKYLFQIHSNFSEV